jgi:serine phosphatase RsbU (regulator of sigma subunit)
MTDSVANDPQPPSRVYKFFLNIARRFWIELDERAYERQLVGVGEVLSTLYAVPFALAGIIWLVLTTDLSWLRGYLGHFLLFAVLIVIFNQFGFFMIIELRRNRYGTADGSMTGIPLWSGALIFGPSIFWLPVLWSVYQYILNWSQATSKSTRWGLSRSFSMNLASETLFPLAAFYLYLAIGGQFPLTEFNLKTITLALVMFATFFIGYTAFWSPYLFYHTWAQRIITGNKEIQSLLKFFYLAIGLPQLANPFASLAAGLYIQNGLLVFLYFIAGMVMVAYLTRRLSWSAERSRQSTRLLEKLETLSRSIINTTPEAENLPEILQEHLTNMFPAGRLVVWIFPEEVLAQQPLEWVPDLTEIWPWLVDRTEGEVFLSQEPLPWTEERPNQNPAIVAPILDMETSQAFGGIYLELHTLVQPWNHKALSNLCPAVQALAAQIASAINQAKSYQNALELNLVNEQLKLAGNIQASLLPFSFPDLPGWQLAVTLDPAGETSGDFFDIIPLDGNRVGFLIADVLDKGLGPALYMTLSRTLIRTYATEFDLEPDLVFFATNERILKDTSANLFVTVFYGVVNLETGEMTYSNAGHNPPYIIPNQNEHEPYPLETTGFPIGIDNEATWTRENIQIHPGDTLILYTDGVPDAQNTEGKFYRQKSLVRVAKKHLGQSAEALQRSILDSVYDFVGDAPPFDDITLMVLVRDVETT